MTTNRIRACLLICLLASSTVAWSQTVPGLINYQGKLMDGTNLFSGLVDITFRLYDAEADGVLHYVDTDTVAVVDGLYSTYIGDGEGYGHLDGALTENEVWIEVEVDGTILTPRERLVSVAYARYAARLPPDTVDSTMLANNAVYNQHIANNQISADKIQAGAIGNTQLAASSVTSNKIDWTTMPSMSLLGYDENGTFAEAPVASGDNAIALGFGAQANGNSSVVGGGQENRADAEWTVIGGGYDNAIEGYAAASTISGGFWNLIGTNAHSATIGGGELNVVETYAFGSTIGGGGPNRIGPHVRYGTIAGGRDNHLGVLARYAAIGGGRANVIHTNSYYATIAGGHENLIHPGATNAVIAGGHSNIVSRPHSSVGGGLGNTASGDISTVGGGEWNTAGGYAATVGGGFANTAGGLVSAAGGGVGNEAIGNFSTIGGGDGNVANGTHATIPGGRNNIATNYAFAAGRRAKAIHEGAFVWGDSTNADFSSVSNNTFLIRASGGVGINTNNPGIHGGAMLAIATPSTNVPAIRLLGPETAWSFGARLAFGDENRVYLMEDEDDTLLIYSDGRTAIMGGNVGINTLNPDSRLQVAGSARIDADLHVDGNAYKPGGGSWTASSDARIKADVHEISGALARLTQLRGVTFEWINPDQHGRSAGEREAGLIAQEVEAVFPEWVAETAAHGADAELVGGDGQMKTLSFPHGFNAYVIEAFKELEAENAELKARLERLEAMMGAWAQ